MKIKSVGLILIVALWIVGGVASAVAQTCPPGYPRVAPDSRYIDHGDGTVTDKQTGLMWRRCSEGQSGIACSGTASMQSWQVALTTAANSSFAGYSDWRLPSVKELQSLVETGCYGPSINSFRFPSTEERGDFWTSSTVASNTSSAWLISLYHGYVGFVAKSQPLGVWLVRAGQ